MSWTAITADEISTLDISGKLHTRTAWLYQGVSQTQLSIARHYGGMQVNGEHYVYCYPTDELIRQDVFSAVQKLRKQHKALDAMAEFSQQLGLYDGGDAA